MLLAFLIFYKKYQTKPNAQSTYIRFLFASAINLGIGEGSVENM